MKRFLSIIVLLAFVLSSGSSLAEVKTMEGDFSIRGGIEFGMSMEKVKAIEPGSGTGSMSDGKSKGGLLYLLYGGYDSIAGIPCVGVNGGQIIYFFSDPDDALTEIEYRFGYYTTNYEEYYQELCDNLAQKYGTPFNSDVNSVFSGASYDLADMLRVSIFQLENVNEWIVSYKDYYVVIDAYMYYAKQDKEHMLYLGYKWLSLDDMSRVKDEIELKEERKTQEVQNDL